MCNLHIFTLNKKKYYKTKIFIINIRLFFKFENNFQYKYV